MNPQAIWFTAVQHHAAFFFDLKKKTIKSDVVLIPMPAVSRGMGENVTVNLEALVAWLS